ncbi:Cytochrome c [Catalinimonas alkaloidigena]|uniref:Cytochrome c n=1 Tax=Catalinimonas alkaloidigena TaxID=1075417 RepID=A0A1G8WUH2_9BACT|nr:cytochrome c [Catalinimonas alkaloidigena]SDJ82008.1 Cytochrome c [Catalinimonas alkaloidigena]
MSEIVTKFWIATLLLLVAVFTLITLTGFELYRIQLEKETPEESYFRCGVTNEAIHFGSLGDSLAETGIKVVSEGQQLFQANCTQCHAIQEIVVGPPLKNVAERHDLDWLIRFVRGPQAVVESGDPAAVALYERYRQFMPNHDFLTEEEVFAIMSYVDYDHVVAQTGDSVPDYTAWKQRQHGL